MSELSQLAYELDEQGLDQLQEYFTSQELFRLVADGAARAEREKFARRAESEFEYRLEMLDW